MQIILQCFAMIFFIDSIKQAETKCLYAMLCLEPYCRSQKAYFSININVKLH